MKVISIKQPFASLIANGYKEYEFRTWRTKYRGEIYIHASLGVDKKAMEKFKFLNLDCPCGVIIAKANLSDCLQIDNNFIEMIKEKNNNRVYDHVIKGDDSKFAFKLNSVQKIDHIKAKGQLGIWNYED